MNNITSSELGCKFTMKLAQTQQAYDLPAKTRVSSVNNEVEFNCINYLCYSLTTTEYSLVPTSSLLKIQNTAIKILPHVDICYG